MTELRRRMDDDMQVRGMADRTRETYLWAVSGLAMFYRRSPDHRAKCHRVCSFPSISRGCRISVMGWEERITVNPAVRSGKPCIKGTRIAVYDVLEYLAGGMTEDQILGDFPDLKRDDIRASLAFAAARERRLSNSVA